MNAHESIRAKLALAAAGALQENDLREVERHARECESCLRELELWGEYTRELRQLPQPVFPSNLLARTQARVLHDHESALQRRRNGLMLCTLAAYSWVVAFSAWIVARTLTGGTLEVFGTNLVDVGPWILTSWVLTWITAGVAAVTLGSRNPARRVL